MPVWASEEQLTSAYTFREYLMVSQFWQLLIAPHLGLAETLVLYFCMFVLLLRQDTLLSVSWLHSYIAKWLWASFEGFRVSYLFIQLGLGTSEELLPS